MIYLVDTGVLLRSVNPGEPARAEILAAFRLLFRQGHTLATSTQNLREFWNVTTRPTSARGGYGQTPEKVAGRLRYFNRFMQTVAEAPSTHVVWFELVEQHRVQGVQVHDAHLVALMKSHGISTILTLNKADFRRYADVHAILPREVMAT